MLLELALLAVVGTAPTETAANAESTPDIPTVEAPAPAAVTAPAPVQAPAPAAIVAPASAIVPAEAAAAAEAPLTVPLPAGAKAQADVVADPGLMGPPVPPELAAKAAPVPNGETQMLPPKSRVIEARLVEDGPAPAAKDAPQASVAQAAKPEQSDRKTKTRFGLTLDAGVPDGVGVTAVYRPFDWVRLHGGYTNNGIGHGLKGGATLVPFLFPVLPTLSLEAGHLFGGNGALLEQFGVDVADELKDSFSYNFYSAHLGLEVGSQNRFLFFLRAGLSRVNATVGGLEQSLQEQTGSSTLEAEPGKLRAGLPSAKLGFIVFFL